MLKLVFYTHDRSLRVRAATSQDQFSHACTWENKISFIISPIADFTMVWTSFLPDLEPVYAESFVRLVSARYPVSGDYLSLKVSCPELLFQDDREEWVFFGGSFNPWHQGHQSCLDLISEDKLCFILPDRNPQKDLRLTHIVSELLQISTMARFKKHQYLVPTFLIVEKKNPTVEWIEKLAREYPDKKLSLLMGFDSFAGLKSWIRPEALLNHLHALYVVSRLEDEQGRKQALDYVWEKGFRNVEFLGRHPHEKVSSTNLRRK